MRWLHRHNCSRRHRQLRACRRRRQHRAIRDAVTAPERLEHRQLLSANVVNVGTGDAFLQGTTFVDANNDGRLDPSDAYLPGATVALYIANGNYSGAPLAQATTDTNGMYRFENVAPGDYHLVEAATGYTNSGTQDLSQINKPLTSSSNSIDVELVDPDALTAVADLSSLTMPPTPPAYWDWYNYTLFGNSQNTVAEQIPLTVTETTPASRTVAFPTFSVDSLNELVAPLQNKFTVMGTSSLPGPDVSSANPGRIAYLYNHYGSETFSDPADDIGLQIAIWKLTYDDVPGTPTFTAQDFDTGHYANLVTNSNSPLGAAGLNAEINRAVQYINESAGKSEVAEFLGATGTVSEGEQSVIATGSLNFGNLPNAAPKGDVDPSVKADQSSITAGSWAGYTVTLTAEQVSKGVTLTDLLPAGAGNDIDWQIDPSVGNASAFILSGLIGDQQLSLNSSSISMSKHETLTVHIVGLTSTADVGALSNTATSSPNPDNDARSASINVVAPTSAAGDVDSLLLPDRLFAAAGGNVGYTLVIYAEANSTGVTLTDTLPGSDINWAIDPSEGNPYAFTLNGNSLALAGSSIAMTKGQVLVVHVVGTTTASDVGRLVDNASVTPNPDNDGNSTAFIVVVPASSNNNPPCGDNDDGNDDDDDGGDDSWQSGAAQAAFFKQFGDDEFGWW